jgi:hypothetical protein
MLLRRGCFAQKQWLPVHAGVQPIDGQPESAAPEGSAEYREQRG